MKLAVLGGGYWGKNLIREFNNCNVLKYICETNKSVWDSYIETYSSVIVTDNYQSILDDKEVTAICIALPAELHYKFAKLALEADKDVFVEKPITLDINEAEELINIAKERNKILMVGHLLHYHPCIEKIKTMLAENKIGKIKSITSNRLSLGIFRKYENVLWSFAPHDISVILSLCGNSPETVLSTGVVNMNKDIYDNVSSFLYFNGIYANINTNWMSPYKEQKLSIVGEKGMILFDDVEKENKLKYIPKYVEYSQDSNMIPMAVKGNEEYISCDMSESPLLKECKHFIECCIERKQPITNGLEGLNVLKVLTKLQESLDSNSEIKIEEKKYFSHQTAIIDDGANIGEGTKIWHYSHICKGAKIGKNCNIGQNVFIAGGAVLGDNCKVQNNVSIYAGVEAEEYVFFGPSCVLTNDINPRGMHSKNGEYIKTILNKGVTLGANCTIVCGNTIGEHSLIGAGCVITKNVSENSIMVGNPGRKIGTIDEKGERKLNP